MCLCFDSLRRQDTTITLLLHSSSSSQTDGLRLPPCGHCGHDDTSHLGALPAPELSQVLQLGLVQHPAITELLQTHVLCLSTGGSSSLPGRTLLEQQLELLLPPGQPCLQCLQPVLLGHQLPCAQPGHPGAEDGGQNITLLGEPSLKLFPPGCGLSRISLHGPQQNK